MSEKALPEGAYDTVPLTSPSATDLLPPSARGSANVQAAFFQGPRSSLRKEASNSDLVSAFDVSYGPTLIIMRSMNHRTVSKRLLGVKSHISRLMAGRYRTRYHLLASHDVVVLISY